MIKKINDRGYSLIEAIIVLAIAATIAGIAVWGYQSIKSSTSIRTTTSDLFSDMLSTQIQALTQRKTFFIVFGANNYTIYEDTYNAADPTSKEGDGILSINAGQDLKIGVYPKNPYYNIFLTTGDGKTVCGTTICFDQQGLFSFYQINNNVVTLSGTKAIVHFDFTNLSTAPEYSCVVIEKTRIIKGEWISASNVCATK
ncbi:MAG: prepilin-type N-terminal cleavage/methylation domain-containing protein [Nitrospirae bacterium]|nr:prepilin-type N-terminal cleavage/methylation domain-containing protein [Nitrospirota bacterium]